jgi:hypothetical protein
MHYPLPSIKANNMAVKTMPYKTMLVLMAMQVIPRSLMTELQWTDQEFADSAYYYVRLTLKPDPNPEESMVNRQQFIRSGPVWVKTGEEYRVGSADTPR